MVSRAYNMSRQPLRPMKHRMTSHPGSTLALVQGCLDHRRGQGTYLLTEHVYGRTVGEHRRGAARLLLGLDVHAGGERVGQVEAGVAVIAVPGAQHRGAVAQLDLGPRHQAFELNAFPALVEVAQKPNRADHRRPGLHFDGLGRRNRCVHPDGLCGGHLLAGAERAGEREHLIRPRRHSLGHLRPVGEDRDR
jgi:hypothetical protein